MAATDDIFATEPIKRGRRESRKLTFLFYQSVYGPIVFLKAVYKQLIILGAMFLWGGLIFAYYGKLPAISALLASVSTITTIGLYVPNNGNFNTMPVGEAVLLIIMILISVGAGASILQGTVNTIVSGDLAKTEAEKRLISRLKNHVIVFGYGHLGKYVGQKLDDIGFDYVILTRDVNLYHELARQGLFTVLEFETHPIEALTQAGIDKASTVEIGRA